MNEFPIPSRWQHMRWAIKAWLAKVLLGDEPLIWTTKGNVPERSLQRYEQWIDNENETTLVEVYMTHDGEEVKRSPHIRLKQQPGIGAQQASLA